jgi:hypothetical protein
MLNPARRAIVAAVGAALICVAAPIAAQDSATAAALFDKGLAEMQAGHFTAACPAFAESYRLDPQPGALFTLAECEAKAGKLASAVIRYDEYLELFSRMTPAQRTGQRGRDKIATEQRQKLSPQVPQLTLTLPAGAPAGILVKRDGQALASVALGTALPVDPGEHVISTTVPGGPEHQQRVTLAAGDKKSMELEIELPSSPAASSAPAAASSSSAPPSASPPTSASAPPSSASGPTPQPRVPVSKGSASPWAYVAGGIGLAGVAVGTVTGLMAVGKKSIVNDNCKDLQCSAKGMDAVDSGRNLALVSTIGFGVGAAGLVTGVVLLMVGGDKGPEKNGSFVRPLIASPTGNDALLGVRGTW